MGTNFVLTRALRHTHITLSWVEFWVSLWTHIIMSRLDCNDRRWCVTAVSTQVITTEWSKNVFVGVHSKYKDKFLFLWLRVSLRRLTVKFSILHLHCKKLCLEVYCSDYNKSRNRKNSSRYNRGCKLWRGFFRNLVDRTQIQTYTINDQ